MAKAARTDLTDTVNHLGGPLRPGKATPSQAWAPLQLSHETSQSLENDGWRLAAFRQRQRVVLQSRSGRDLGRRVLTFAWGEAVRMRAAASVALPGLWRASTTGAPCWASILGRVEADSGGGP